MAGFANIKTWTIIRLIIYLTILFMRMKTLITFFSLTAGLVLLSACQAQAPAAPGEKVTPEETTQAAVTPQVNLPQDSAKALPAEPEKNLPEEAGAKASEAAGAQDLEELAKTPSVEDSPTEEKAVDSGQ